MPPHARDRRRIDRVPAPSPAPRDLGTAQFVACFPKAGPLMNSAPNHGRGPVASAYLMSDLEEVDDCHPPQL